MNETKPAENSITVSEMVRRNYRTAEVFRKWGINYCCSGNLPLAEACAQKDINPALIQRDLDLLAERMQAPELLAAEEWPLDFLIDYIVHVHHAYLNRMLPAMRSQLHAFVAGHLQKYPYLQEVEEVFNDLAGELADQNGQEEESIFPYLKQVISTYKRRETYGSLFVRTLGKPLDQRVAADHKRIMALLTQLRIVTENYHPKDEACTNHLVIFHKLAELDRNLMLHKHLENNILYPRVLQMERELLGQVVD